MTGHKVSGEGKIELFIIPAVGRFHSLVRNNFNRICWRPTNKQNIISQCRWSLVLFLLSAAAFETVTLDIATNFRTTT